MPSISTAFSIDSRVSLNEISLKFCVMAQGNLETVWHPFPCWALGNSASALLSLPKDEVVVLTANVKTLKFVKPQRVTIKVDSQEIGMWEIGSALKWEKHSIVIEPDEHRPDVSVKAGLNR